MWSPVEYHDVFSWDCANKSIACTKLKIAKNTEALIEEVATQTAEAKLKMQTDTNQNASPDPLEKIAERVDWLRKNLVILEFINSCDTLEGQLLRDTTAPSRGKAIKQFLSQYAGTYEWILVEYQMSANFKSAEVSSQLIYHFCDKAAEVVVVGPATKNKCIFAPTPAVLERIIQSKRVPKKIKKIISEYPNLAVGSFIERYASNWAANKAHSAASFVVFLACIERLDLLDNINISHLPDIADSCLQALMHFGF